MTRGDVVVELSTLHVELDGVWDRSVTESLNHQRSVTRTALMAQDIQSFLSKTSVKQRQLSQNISVMGLTKASLMENWKLQTTCDNTRTQKLFFG